MMCGEFEELVHDLVRMDLLDVNEREALLEHAAHCANCAQRMAAATALVEASQAAGGAMREEQAPARVEATLLAEFREHHGKIYWRRTFEWLGVGAAAAVLLAFLWTVSRGPNERPTPVQKKDPVSRSGVPLDARATPAQKPGAVAVQRPSVESADLGASATYAASDFVPVPYAGPITADDPGIIVRVQLTRASLAQLGYPVAEAPGEDLISADVLVGEDGWPRGVKLIH